MINIQQQTIVCQLKDIPQNSMTPILTYCRKLMKAGYVPETKLNVYRGEMACLSMPIGDGAKLTVKDNQQGTPVFMKFREFSKNF